MARTGQARPSGSDRLATFSQGCLFIFCALVFLSARPGGAYAQNGYPPHTDLRVNDFANILSPGDVGELRGLFDTIKRQKDIEAVVVTIQSIRDYPVGAQTIESFATGLFNTWGVGVRGKNNGVMILVAVRDRKVRIELGSGYGRDLDQSMAEIIQNTIVPCFRRNDYRAGILDGAKAVLESLGATAGAAGQAAPQSGNQPVANAPDPKPLAEVPLQPTGQPMPFQPRPAPMRNNIVPPYHLTTSIHWEGRATGFGLFPMLGLFGVVAALVGFVARYRYQNRPRLCTNCAKEMTHLDELSDDMYLDSGQQLEEALNSVNYDVWRCPTCNLHTIERHNKWFSTYHQCPECGYKTLSESCDTIEQPTYFSTGRKRISRTCRKCSYMNEDYVTLPMLTNTDTSSSCSSSSSSFGDSGGGGSFGGGSSSGGGASGSW